MRVAASPPPFSIIDGTSGTKEEKKAKEGKFFKQKMCWPITWLIYAYLASPTSAKMALSNVNPV
jgi:hypothetical protein